MNIPLIQPFIAQADIGTLESLLGAAVVLIGLGVAWGVLKKSVGAIEKILSEEIKPDLKDVRERFGGVESKVETLWKDKYAPATSPRQLNETGETILRESGIKEIIEDKQEDLLEIVKAMSPDNAYDAEQCVIAAAEQLPETYPELTDQLRDGAFKVGENIDAVLFVGSIYLRNQIFPALGFEVDDIDQQNKK